MKKILVLLVSSLVLFSCSQEVKKVQVTKQVEVSQSDLAKVCDSLIFNGNTKIKIKLENVKVDGKPMDLDAECEISLDRQ
jgi:uncharacterized lipoprotein YajG